MFSFFKSHTPQDEMRRALAAFEKVSSITSDSREARSMRLRMGLICRAHLDKTFIAGAEQTAVWQEQARVALLASQPLPELPKASKFQKIRAADAEIYAYLPEEFVNEAFDLGSKYQKMEVSAHKAIDAMQGLANHISRYELRLQEPFQVLDFLREELAAQAALVAQAELLAEPPADAGEGASAPLESVRP
jgi:hypothetical protein